MTPDERARLLAKRITGWFSEGEQEHADEAAMLIAKEIEEVTKIIPGKCSIHNVTRGYLCSVCVVETARDMALKEAEDVCGESCAWTAQKAIRTLRGK